MNFISFKQFLIEASDTKTGNYVSIACKMPQLTELMDVASGKITKDPHITLVYSKEQSVDPKTLLNDLSNKFKDYGVAKVTQAAIFGEEDEQCIVLKLDSPLLHRIHEYLLSVGNIKHSYDKYEPHITLFYDVKKEEAEYWVDWLNRQIKQYMIEFKGFESTTIIEDWNK